MQLLNILILAKTAAAAALPPLASPLSPSIQYAPSPAGVEAAREAYHTTHNTTSPSSLQKRAPNGAGVYTCNATDWQGRCTWRFFAVNKCHDLRPEWSQQLRSFGPDLAQGFACELWEHKGCPGANSYLMNPGSGRLGPERGMARAVRCGFVSLTFCKPF